MYKRFEADFKKWLRKHIRHDNVAIWRSHIIGYRMWDYWMEDVDWRSAFKEIVAPVLLRFMTRKGFWFGYAV